MARSHYRSIGNEMVMLTADDVIPYGRPMRRSQPQLIIAWDRLPDTGWLTLLRGGWCRV
jgi:hypothetical protein